MKTTYLISILLLLPTLALSDGGSHNDGQAPSVRVLGTIDFPTSTDSGPAQEAFIQGMLLMHLFEYPFAEEKFIEAQQLDPEFAMAYWGEAMTHNHPIWDEQDREKALAVLFRLGDTPAARAAKAGSDKERDWLAALDVLYGEGDKATRDQAYLRHLQLMARRYPGDHEVRLFLALAHMGAHAGVRDIPAYMESTALSQSVFSQNSKHPGAAHYLIHGVDDPIHAPLGLDAARALGAMAPDAGHSLHMTSHIYVALGMWEDVVRANREGVKVQNAMRVTQGLPERHWGHYNFWMLYGLLQQGRYEEARALLEAAYAEAKASGATPADPLELTPDRSQIGSLVQMWGRYMIETRGGDDEIASWTFNTGEAFDPRLNFAFYRGLKTANSYDLEAAEAYLAEFRSLKKELHDIIMAAERQAPQDLLYLDRLAVMEQELMTLIAWYSGDKEQALAYAREASRLEGEMPFAFGPPYVDLPAAEMLGGFLMGTGQYAEAAQAFHLQLQRSRNKTLALAGLESAYRALGQEAEANYTGALLAANRKGGDPSP